jgi:hypothetical protein
VRRLVRLLPALGLAFGAAGCGNELGPAMRDLTVQMSEGTLSLAEPRSIVLDPAPLRGAAQIQASATVSYLSGTTVAVRAQVPAPPAPGRIGRIVRVDWLGCDRLEGEFTCVVANLQSDRRVTATFTSLEIFPLGPP